MEVFNEFMKFNDDYIFIKNKNIAIHKILSNSNITDDFMSYDK